MKNKIVLLLLLVLSSNYLMGQNFNWVRSLNSPLEDIGSNVVLDKYGNTYVAGRFGSYTYLGGALGNYHYLTTSFMFVEGDTLINYGYNNSFLVKYDNVGNLIWAKSIGGENGHDDYDQIRGLVYDSVGDHLIAAGTLTGLVTIDTITLHCTASDVFLAKFDLDGKCIWGKNFVGVGADVIFDIDVDESSNIYLTGINQSAMSIDSITLAAGGFLAKFDADGNCVMAKREFPDVASINLTYTLYPTTLRVKNNEVVIAGYTDAPSITVDTLLISDSNYKDGIVGYYAGFLSKFDDSGNLKWAKYLGSPRSGITGLDIDESGIIYCTGSQFDTSFYDNISLATDGGFIFKCNPVGDVIKLQRIGTSGQLIYESIKLDELKNCYLTGQSMGSMTFGNSVFPEMGNFLVKYSPDWDFQWAQQVVGGSSSGHPRSVDLDKSKIVVVGEFSKAISINSTTTIKNSDSIYFTSDVFLARYDNSSGFFRRQDEPNTLHIFSNPTNGKFSVVIPTDFMHQSDMKLSIFDPVGKKILYKGVESDEETLTVDIHGYSSGFYLISLTDGMKVRFGKVLLK